MGYIIDKSKKKATNNTSKSYIIGKLNPSWEEKQKTVETQKLSNNQKIVSSYEPPKNYEVIPNLLPQSPKANNFVPNISFNDVSKNANVNVPGFNLNLGNKVSNPMTMLKPNLGQNYEKEIVSKAGEFIGNIPLTDPVTYATNKLLGTDNYFRVKDLARPSDASMALGEKTPSFIDYARENAKPSNTIRGLDLPSNNNTLDYATFTKQQAQNKLNNSLEALKGKYSPNPLRLGATEKQVARFETKDTMPALTQIGKLGISGVMDPLNFVGADLISGLSKGKKLTNVSRYADDIAEMGVKEFAEKQRYLAEQAPTIRKNMESFLRENKLRQTPQGKATLNFGKQLALEPGRIYAGPSPYSNEAQFNKTMQSVNKNQLALPPSKIELGPSSNSVAFDNLKQKTKQLSLEAPKPKPIQTMPNVNPKAEFETLKQTMVQKYTQAYDEVVQEIQNKAGNYELNAAEQSKYSDLIQQATDNIQKAEYYTKLTPEKLRGKLNAGVIEPEELEYFDRIRQYSEAKTNLGPKLSIEPNYNLAKGTTEQPKKVFGIKPIEPNYTLAKGTKDYAIPLNKAIKQTPKPEITEPNYNISRGTKERIIPLNKVEAHGPVKPSNIDFKTEISKELTPIKSNRQLPKGLSDTEFDKYYKLDQTPSKKAIETMVEDIGARVINKYKTNDIPSIAKSYINKYNLPDNVKVSFTLKNDLNKATTQPIRDLNGNVIGARININPNQSIYGKVGSLRHEIEHYKDLVEGYAEASNKYKYNPKIDKTAKDLYTNASKGHHKNYGWFEYDYLKKAIQEDNLQPTESIVKPQKETSNIVNTPQINNAQNVNKTVAREYMKPLDEPRITGSDIAAEGQTNTRGFSKNIKTDENTNKDIREYFTEKPIEYNRLENKKLAEHAQTRFKNEKLDNLVTEFKTKTNFKPEDIPLSRLVANEVAKKGDLKSANEIVSKIAEKLTESGQFSQAAKVLRKSNPSALMEYLQRSIVKLNEKGAEKYGSKWKNINLSEQVQKEIYNLKLFDEEAIEKAMNKAHDDINTQLPASNMEKLDAWRRMAMLLNPKTHIRNVLGNALMMPARGISETMSTVAESVMLKNKPELRTKSFGYKNNKAIVKTVEETWNTLKDDLINGSGRYDIESALSVGNKEKRIFKNNVLEKVNVKSKEWLNKGDEIFMQKAFKDSLGSYMKVQNLTEATTEAIEYATKKSHEATYRQANAFADWLNRAKRSTTKGGKVGGFVADVTVPFVKTPANILKTSYEYSPMGFVSMAKSGKTASEAIDIMTKGLTGTGLFVAGCALANLGWARSARENSKNAEALSQMKGENYNSITTPWGSYSFDWASPIAVPLAMGISVVESFDKKNISNNWVDKFTNVLYNTGNAGLDSLVNMSMLQGIKEALGGYGSNMDKVMGVPEDFLSQMVPTMFNQAARIIDPVKRNTYDPNKVKSFGKTLVNKIPFASKTLQPKVDVLGNEVTTGSLPKRLLVNLISPGAAMSKTDNSNIKELSRLYEKNKDTAILPKVAPKSFKIDGEDKLLTPKELTQFQKTMGENELKGLTKALGNKNDDKKTKDLTKLATESYSKAKVELLKNRGIKTYVKKSVIPVNSLKIKP